MLGILARRIIGWFLVVFGFFGLIVPLLSGIIFIAIGLYILALDSLWWKQKFEVLKKRFPVLEKLKDMFDGHIKKTRNHDSR